MNMHLRTKRTVFLRSEQVPQIKVYKYIFTATLLFGLKIFFAFSGNVQQRPDITTNID